MNEVIVGRILQAKEHAGVPVVVVSTSALHFDRVGFSLLVKPVAFVILPILFLHEHGDQQAKVAALPLAVLLIPFIPYAFDANPFEALVTFSKHWFFNGALLSVLFPLISDNQTTRLWCFAFLAMALFVLYMSRKPLNEKIALRSFASLFTCRPSLVRNLDDRPPPPCPYHRRPRVRRDNEFAVDHVRHIPASGSLDGLSARFGSRVCACCCSPALRRVEESHTVGRSRH